MSTSPTTILVGLSGPSSSGKTTLARLLRSICNVPAQSTQNGSAISLFILHEDDFYKTDTEIPVVTVHSSTNGTRELLDWDCAESLDIPLLESTLTHVKAHGTLPPDTVSKEDQNAIGDSGVSAATTTSLQTEFQTWFSTLDLNTNTNIRICIIDGFLLYPAAPSAAAAGDNPTDIARLHAATSTLFDLKLFLLSGKQTTIARRAARAGYVTLEGFWTDPPGYVEDVVWPNYARDHAWMFQGGDVEGVIDADGVRKEAIQVVPQNGDLPMLEVLRWALLEVKRVVGKV